jgi:hypothetical protein
MSGKQLDNSTFEQKARLRRRSLRELAGVPVVMETHGGFGRLYTACYSGIAQGVVFERLPRKAAALALQRPTWAVYEADCETAIRAGVGSHLAVNFLDLDPYGEPWPILEAFFTSARPFPQRMVVVVNDGLRQKLQMGGGWNTKSLEAVVRRWGNAKLYKYYLEICRELVQEKTATAGYRMKRWAGYYCSGGHMTHYAAMLCRES